MKFIVGDYVKLKSNGDPCIIRNKLEQYKGWYTVEFFDFDIEGYPTVSDVNEDELEYSSKEEFDEYRRASAEEQINLHRQIIENLEWHLG